MGPASDGQVRGGDYARNPFLARPHNSHLRRRKTYGLTRHPRPANALKKQGGYVVKRLEGKIAIVVGAGSIGPGWGNGKAAAVTFARAGARVFCVDRHRVAAEETASLIAAEGGQATAFAADASR